ncbi:MAG: hypothetical protein GY778_03565 [bacterium]|nr:hypothetical protein [bacterium]
MPKPKDGPALFEIMRKMGPDRAEAPAEEPVSAPAMPAKPPRTEARPAEARPEIPDRSSADQGDSEGPAPPLYEVAGGRIRLALTSQAMAVAVFGLGLLLLAAYTVGLSVGRNRGEAEGYEAGQAAAQADAMDSIQEARAQQPTKRLFEGVGISPVATNRGPEAAAESASATSPAGGVTSWVRGYTYVVVQDFQADARDDVDRAQRFLADNGIDTAVVELTGNWKYRLVTTQGFNWDDPLQRDLANDYLARTRRLGQTFFEAGGRYRLKGYFKKLKGERW